MNEKTMMEIVKRHIEAYPMYCESVLKHDRYCFNDDCKFLSDMNTCDHREFVWSQIEMVISHVETNSVP